MATSARPPTPPPLLVEVAIARAVAAHEGEAGALLPILHSIQDELGWLPPEVQPRVAEALNLSRAEVHGVITFYHDFRTAPPGRTIVLVCRAEACQALGADALVEHACARLGVALHHTRGDGAVSLQPVFCLGNCALSPSVMVNGRLVGRVSPARFDALVAHVPKEGA